MRPGPDPDSLDATRQGSPGVCRVGSARPAGWGLMAAGPNTIPRKKRGRPEEINGVALTPILSSGSSDWARAASPISPYFERRNNLIPPIRREIARSAPCYISSRPSKLARLDDQAAKKSKKPRAMLAMPPRISDARTRPPSIVVPRSSPVPAATRCPAAVARLPCSGSTACC